MNERMNEGMKEQQCEERNRPVWGEPVVSTVASQSGPAPKEKVTTGLLKNRLRLEKVPVWS